MCCVFVCVFHLIEAEANNEADDVGDDDDDGETFPRVARQKCPLNPDFGLNSIVSFRRTDIFWASDSFLWPRS